MPARACVRARAAAGGGRQAGRRRCRSRSRARDRARAWAWAWVWVRVQVPYLAWFFLNRVSRVWATPLPKPDPTRYPDPKLQLDSQRSQLLDSQQVRLLGRTVATVQSEPLQPFVGFEPVGPSWSAI